MDVKDMNENKNIVWKLIDTTLKWRRLLVINTILAVLITFIVMLFFPNWYAATTTIMPPDNDSGGLGIMAGMLPAGMGAVLGGSGLSLPGMATASDLYAAILKSRAVSMAVLEKNNLKEIYGEKLDADALAALHARTSIIVEPEGIIALSHEEKNPELAAKVANDFIIELNRVNQENLVTKARYTREFIERRLNEAITDLSKAEEEIQKFQKDNKTFSLEEEVKAAINTIATLKGELVLAEIEFGVMKKSLSPNNSKYKMQSYKIEQIRNQIDKMESGEADTLRTPILNIPLYLAPDLGLKYIRLMRELKIQETIFELLKQQYEQAKIQETRDTPTIQVLDVAKPPEIKSRPKRVFTSLLAGILCFGLTFFIVLANEYIQREKKSDSDFSKKITGFSKMLNEDYYWIRSVFRRKGK
jgi:uncharacterized protein involved in exopolysaccharide biosynthesis